MREIAELALSGNWTMDAALALIPAQDGPLSLVAAYEAGIASLESQEPKLIGPLAAKVRDALKPIGMKIRPDMSDVAKSEWLSAMMLALSDLPPKVIQQSARVAIRRSIAFLSEVDTAVREEAQPIMARHATALRRLRALEKEIADAASPKLEAPEGWRGADRPQPTADELRKMGGSPLGRAVLKLGLANGHLTQDQYDEAAPSIDEDELGQAATQ